MSDTQAWLTALSLVVIAATHLLSWLGIHR